MYINKITPRQALLIGLVLSGLGAAAPVHAWTGPEVRMDAPLRRQARSAALVYGDALTSCFVRSTAPATTRRRVQTLGGSVGTTAGDILTVRIPRGALEALAAGSEIRRMEAARPVRRKLDQVLEVTSAAALHAGAAPLDAPVTGEGVIVGVIDYGLDLSHDAFQNADGTAVLALWDQNSDLGTPPAHYGYGSVCESSDIDGGACSHSSDDEHGTHVTGIAAGRPSAGRPYYGLAPDADILFVNLGWAPNIDDWDEAFTTAVCDGAAWIFSEADSRGLPAVINMSIGAHEGPHDGHSLASQCLDNLTGPGRILVAAAGNEGEGGYHWVADEDVFLHVQGMAKDIPQRVGFRPSWDDDPTDVPSFYGYLWFDAPTNLSVRMGIEQEDGEVVFTEWVSWEEGFEGALLVDGTEAGPVWLEGWEADGDGRAMMFAIDDEDLDDLERGARWILEITGDGAFDGFIDTTPGSGFVPEGTTEAAVDNHMSIGYPAVAARVIAVASYVTRNTWIDVDGHEHVQEDWYTGEPVPIGSLSGFSSRGPSRDEAHTGVKPNVAAPGETIISALNADVWSPEMAEQVVEGALGNQNSYATIEGTSMASPAVTGAVALLLQADPTLDPAGVLALLQATSIQDSEVTDGTPYDWGVGKLDILAAVLEIPGEVFVAEEEPADAWDSTNTPEDSVAQDASSPTPSQPKKSGCAVTADAAPAGAASALLPLLTLLALISIFRRRTVTPRAIAKSSDASRVSVGGAFQPRCRP